MSFVALLSSLLLLLAPSQTDTKVEWLGPLNVELGEVHHQKPTFVRFPFRNVSPSPLTIDNIRTSCGCTVPDWSDAAVAPGDTSSILIEYDAEKMGYFKQWIRVFFHGQRKGEHLWIEGEVVD
ncbi:MAG: DUF1573 domain-containing protein [Lewinellaceae bacterium]|nr:DUF1573 domain-containing protein [Lewinellaceae bacterium]